MRDVAFDTETTGLDPFNGDVPFLVQAADDDDPLGDHAPVGPALETVSWPEPYAIQRRLDAADRVVGANLAFDVHMAHTLGEGWDLLTKRLADVADLARIVAPERRIAEKGDDGNLRGYKLKDLAATFFDPAAKDSEEELERLAQSHGFKLHAKPGGKGYKPSAYFELWKLEPEAMEFYAREDVRITRGLLLALEDKLNPATQRIWDLEQAALPIIIGAERAGVRVDEPAAVSLRKEYVREAERTHAELDRQLGDGWDENNDEIAERLLMAGVPLTETTDSGQLATNKWALERLKDEHPVIQTLFDHRLASKFVSTYLDHFVDHEVIHPHFMSIGTWTGRMACIQPNMQNVPARVGTAVRDLFIPREGSAFVGIDFEQIELRLLGYYLNDPTIQAKIAEGKFFEWVAAQVWGGHEADYAKGTPGEAQRTIAKNTTYAVVYGAGGMKVAKMLGWPPDAVYGPNDWVVKRGYKQAGEPRCLKAETLVKQLKSIWTGYGTPAYRGPGSGSGLLGRVSDKVAAVGAVDTILGRHQWLGYDGAWKALSGLIQGSAADLFKLAVVESAPVAAELGAYPVLFIHDEIVFEAPTENAEEVLDRCGRAMAECYELKPALEVDGSIGWKTWGGAK